MYKNNKKLIVLVVKNFSVMRTVIVPGYGFLSSRFRKLWNITSLAKRQGLHLLNHEVVGAHVIALDASKRKLIFANTSPVSSSCLIIDLNNLETCSIKKEYTSIDAGALKNRKLYHFLKSVFLNLVFKNSSDTLALPLFNAQNEEVKNIEHLEAQAKRWESIISKVLPLRISDRA